MQQLYIDFISYGPASPAWTVARAREAIIHSIIAITYSTIASWSYGIRHGIRYGIRTRFYKLRPGVPRLHTHTHPPRPSPPPPPPMPSALGPSSRPTLWPIQPPVPPLPPRPPPSLSTPRPARPPARLGLSLLGGGGGEVLRVGSPSRAHDPDSHLLAPLALPFPYPFK